MEECDQGREETREFLDRQVGATKKAMMRGPMPRNFFENSS